MKRSRGSRTARRSAASGEDAARARVEAVFEAVDRLTPDELGRIGLERPSATDQDALHHAVASAARRSGRGAMVHDARQQARDTLLRRFSEGGLNPTWIALNWGVSQGTADSRAALIEAVEDAAGVAVVADVVDPDVVEAMSLDGTRITGMAVGSAYGGSFDRVISQPPRPEYHASRMRWLGAAMGASFVAFVAFSLASLVVGPEAAFVVAGALGIVVIWSARVRRPARSGDPADG